MFMAEERTTQLTAEVTRVTASNAALIKTHEERE
jgi:hypothetical protein